MAAQEKTDKEYQRILSVIKTGDRARIAKVLQYANCWAARHAEVGTDLHTTRYACQNLVMSGWLTVTDANDYAVKLTDAELDREAAAYRGRVSMVEKYLDQARRKGSVMIGIHRSPLGTTELVYNKEARNYSLLKFNTEHIVTHARSGMVDFLARNAWGNS
jgi:hypothetical protein